ncbi:hypothetical protein BGW41_003479 [Actinomortierella wolfii]|nr:hypothetical protein BGW41_003479 [Actinomortierella wolfii]
MGDVSAGFHVGRFAEDPYAALRQVFEVRENQQDGLGSILKYCQDKCGFMPGNTDPNPLLDSLQSDFGNVFKSWPDPTTFMNYIDHLPGPPSTIDMVEHLPDNSRLLRFLNSLPTYGKYDRSIVQFISEVQGDYLSLYMVKISIQHDDGKPRSDSVGVAALSVDRDAMARNAEDLTEKIQEKERIDDWGKGISSEGYQ